MTTTARPPASRRLRRGPLARRQVVLLLVVLPTLLGVACRVDGTARIAPYRSLPPAQVTARVLTGGAGVLAGSPDGSLSAVADAARGVCLTPTGASAAAPAVCARIPLTGGAAVTAAFSPDGRWLAVGQGIGVQRGGQVWLVDPRTGAVRGVPTADGRPAGSSPATSGPSSAPRSGAPSTPPTTTTARPAPSLYIGMVWGAAGDLLLISSSQDTTGTRTRLVDVDPLSLVPRVVAEATGPYEFQSGYLASGGATAVFTVYRGDQLQANLVTVDLNSGRRREFSSVGPAGTQPVPLAVSPDGRVAVVGLATLTDPGPPRLLDVATGALTDMPGLTGNFALAAFSPDGARVAVAATGADGRVSLALVSLGVAPLAAARTVSTTAGPLPRAGRLAWSRFDVLSIAAAAVPGPASLVGWRLTG